VIAGDTYNYYYYSDNAPRQDALDDAQKKLEEKPPAEPADESQTDRYFEQGVKAFETGDYDTATAKFQDALELTPDDIVLPFAHVQALFANGEYEKAADGLRKALIKASPEKEGVFYPRGLYPDESVLQKQVEQLTRAVRLNQPDSNLELLLGYQLLGLGRYDEAVGHLQNARLNSDNSQAATALMNLLKKLIKANKDNLDSDEQQAEKLGKLQSNSPKVKLAGQGDDRNANAPEKLDDEDIDFRAFAMSAENWLAEN
jgi:tetratricopeptide (TPR) repeat protein